MGEICISWLTAVHIELRKKAEAARSINFLVNPEINLAASAIDARVLPEKVISPARSGLRTRRCNKQRALFISGHQFAVYRGPLCSSRDRWRNES